MIISIIDSSWLIVSCWPIRWEWNRPAGDQSSVQFWFRLNSCWVSSWIRTGCHSPGLLRGRRSESLTAAAAICRHQPAGWHTGTDVHSAVWTGPAERQDSKQNMETKNLNYSDQKSNSLGNQTTNFSELSCLKCSPFGNIFYFCRKKIFEVIWRWPKNPSQIVEQQKTETWAAAFPLNPSLV